MPSRALPTEPRWDVLELPIGSHPSTVFDPDGSLRVGHGSHIYLFNVAAGKWTDIDTNAILNAP